MRKLLIAAVLLAFLIRIVLLFLRRIPSGDEIWALFLAQASFRDIWLSTFSDLHPPFYFLLLHIFSFVLPFDLNLTGLRLISLFFGILGNFGMWYLGTIVLGKRAGLIAFYLSLFVPAFIVSAIYGRYYSFLILLTIGVLVSFIHFLKSGNLKYLVLLIILSTVGIYTHYYFFLLDVALAVFLIFSKKYRYLFAKWILALISIALLFSPGLYYLLTLPKPELFGRHANYFGKIPGIVVTNLTSAETLLYLYFAGNFLVYFPVLAILGAVVVALGVYGFRRWHGDLRMLFASVVIVPPTIAAIVAYTVAPFLAIGSLQIFIPAWLIVLAKGIALDFKKTKILTAAFGLTIFVSLIFLFKASYSMYWKVQRDLRYFVQEFKAGDMVLHADIGSFFVASYYVGTGSNFEIVRTRSSTPQTAAGVGFKPISQAAVMAHEGRLWYFEPSQRTDEVERVKTQLDQNFRVVYSERFGETGKKFQGIYFNVYLYEPR